MSRSGVSSRRSLGINSSFSQAPQLPDVMSIASKSRLSYASQLSLSRRGSLQGQKTIKSKIERARMILVNLSGDIVQMPICEEKQIDLSLSINNLESELNSTHVFWQQWFYLKQDIIDEVTASMDRAQSYSEIIRFTESSFDNFAQHLGKLQQRLSENNQSSNTNYIKLNESFTQLRTVCIQNLNRGTENTQASIINSVIFSIKSFQSDLKSKYEPVYQAAERNSVKKTKFQGKGLKIISVLLQRLIGFNDPIQNIEYTKKVLDATEMHLRKLISDFPEKSKRIVRSKSISPEMKTPTISELQQMKQNLTNELERAQHDLDIAEQQVIDEKREWNDKLQQLSKEISKRENMTIDDVITETQKAFDELQARKRKFMSEIKRYSTSINADYSIEEVEQEMKENRAEARRVISDYSTAEDDLIKTRAANEIRHGDENEDKINTVLFFERQKLQHKLDATNKKLLFYSHMKTRRIAPPPASIKDERFQQAQERIQAIESSIDKISLLSDRLDRHRFRNVFDRLKLSKEDAELRDIEEHAEQKQQEIKELQQELQVLNTDPRISTIQNSDAIEVARKNLELQLTQEIDTDEYAEHVNNLIVDTKMKLIQMQAQLDAIRTSLHPIEQVNSQREKLIKESDNLKQTLLQTLRTTRLFEVILDIEKQKIPVERRVQAIESEINLLTAKTGRDSSRMQAEIEWRERQISYLTDLISKLSM